jgi:2,5-furandicarboxylate decarboxylase 1
MISDEFRLRTFVDRLAEAGDLLIDDDPVSLAQVAGRLEAEPRATLFRNLGGTGEQLVGNVIGSRARLALALGTAPDGALAELTSRLARPGELREVESAEAPVHQVIQTGDEIDLTTFPVHLQHEYDGAPYISAAYDVSRKANPDHFNLGCRRLMLRGKRTTGVDLNAPSDLRVRYLAAVEAGERLPVAFVVGSHPLDYLGATMQGQEDELRLVSSLRGAPLPVVKCVTQDLLVPADCEIVLEGYLDPAGYVEREGPYGEYMGFYGETKLNPLFHVTAVTRRSDALFQTVTISGKKLAQTDTAQLASLATEIKLWDVLSRAVKQPVAVYDVPSSGGISNNARVSMRSVYPGESRNAILAILGSVDVKTVVVTDEDIDIFSDEEVDWAMATRFQPDVDTIVVGGLRSTPLDPSVKNIMNGGAKLGLDLTRGIGQGGKRWSVPEAPVIEIDAAAQTRAVLDILSDGPATFADLMRRAATADGRELVRQLDDALAAGAVQLDADGTWQLVPESAGGPTA